MATLSPSLTDLANLIKDNAGILQKYFTDNSIPSPSFGADAFPFFPGTGPQGIDPFPTPSPEIRKARSQLRQACDTLLALATSPAEQMILSCCQYHWSACIQYAYHFKVAENIPEDGSISYDQLAQTIGVSVGPLKRILRYLMTANYFHEPTPGQVAHTVGSRLLIVMKDTVGYLTEESFPGGPKISAVTEQFPGSEERNEGAWNLAHGQSKPIFEFFETDPKRMTRFFGNMDTIGRSEGWNIAHLLNGYDWKALGKAKVVDVGGNIGHACFAISEVAPELEFVVQDLENVVKGSKELAQAQTNDKVRFQVHDFFQPQPIVDADVYLLRFILHDYPDKYAAKILQSIVPAMGRKSRLIIMDGVIPEPGVLTKVDERQMRVMDMEMMFTFNAVERDEESWKLLFTKADPRLVLKSTSMPSGSAQSIMEVVLS